MKKSKMIIQNAFFLLLSFLFSLTVYAQDKSVDVNISSNKGGGGGFFSSPVVWVIGVAVFVLLLVALLRGNRKD